MSSVWKQPAWPKRLCNIASSPALFQSAPTTRSTGGTLGVAPPPCAHQLRRVKSSTARCRTTRLGCSSTLCQSVAIQWNSRGSATGSAESGAPPAAWSCIFMKRSHTGSTRCASKQSNASCSCARVAQSAARVATPSTSDRPPSPLSRISRVAAVVASSVASAQRRDTLLIAHRPLRESSRSILTPSSVLASVARRCAWRAASA
mmetsp:Transcript_7610/g.30912  ORF Transcript_7610/g.30912 Transcript_7610/m.30912 type:complete len:204 (+) Transcript_7610:644-1255(+)